MNQTHAVEFTKYHGTGNDFLVVDAADPVPDRAAFARTHCDRETGVRVGDDGRRGADGVLFLHVEELYSPSRIVMTLVQPDGSTAAMCGNGARVVGAWAHERTGEREFMIDTQAGTRHAFVRETGDGEGTDPTAHVEIEMGEPSFDPDEVPATTDEPILDDPVATDALREAGVDDAAGLTVTAVDTGVPHAVVFVDDVDAVDLEAVAEPIRHADVFPEGANVDLAARVTGSVDDPSSATDGPGEGTDGDAVPTFRQRTYERGVEGETRSCGTGAVAIAAAARRLGRVDTDVIHTRPPGGELAITLDGDAKTLGGPVEREFTGTLAADPR